MSSSSSSPSSSRRKRKASEHGGTTGPTREIDQQQGYQHPFPYQSHPDPSLGAQYDPSNQRSMRPRIESASPFSESSVPIHSIYQYPIPSSIPPIYPSGPPIIDQSVIDGPQQHQPSRRWIPPPPLSVSSSAPSSAAFQANAMSDSPIRLEEELAESDGDLDSAAGVGLSPSILRTIGSASPSTSSSCQSESGLSPYPGHFASPYSSHSASSSSLTSHHTRWQPSSPIQVRIRGNSDHMLVSPPRGGSQEPAQPNGNAFYPPEVVYSHQNSLLRQLHEERAKRRPFG